MGEEANVSRIEIQALEILARKRCLGIDMIKAGKVALVQ